MASTLLPPIIYTHATGADAISQGTWTISPRHTPGVKLAGVLPLEEIVFFVLTNVLIGFDTTLFITIAQRAALSR